MSTLAQRYQRAMSGQGEADWRLQRFSPAEIRVAVAQLVADDQFALADALALAALTLYPDSEDVLAICALMAEIRQDWAEADQLLGQMVAANGMSATATTWLHWIRVVQCRFDLPRALTLAQLAQCEHPHDPALRDALTQLDDAQPSFHQASAT